MDVSSIASTATDMQASRLKQEVSTTMLKKAIDTQAAAAEQLIASLPQTTSTGNLPPNLGQNVNTTA